MHGRPRKAYKPEEEAASAAKAVKFRSLQSQFLSNHHNKIYTKEAINLSTKLLEINPEAYTAWNYRKLAVEDTLSREESNPDLVKSVLDEELKVVESSLKENVKSYGAWHHRKWVLSKGHSSVGNELRLLNEFQTLDSRNFHAWNYRRFVVELTNRSKHDELKYTEFMIGNNISNYSAWHNRSVLLSSLLERKADGFMPSQKIPEEYELVHNAIFTDEDVQSGWFYHLWLLDQTVNVETPLLISSWPPHGSRINLSRAGCLNDSSSSSKLTTFPLILYFDQAVGGVSSSTVAIDSELKGIEDLVWEPVSNKNSQVSCVWVARLKYMSSEPCFFPKEYKVKVRIGNSPGIVSSSGCNFSVPYEFVFTARVEDTTVQEEPREVIVSWTDGFDIWDAQSEDLKNLVNLDQLNGQMDFKWRQEAIAEEIDLFRTLPDSNSKIGKLTIARLLMAKATMSENDVKGVHYEEILKLYNDLMALDSTHYHYYKDEHSVALLRKVTSSTESLSRHLFRYSDMNNSVCLRLNNSSLSRIASVEKLLFVQMLDLSHNELHSTEGLEAMQLLSCLNLSHNRIRSFSALDSLRHLKQLRVLDVSHNHIGEHSVDTTRYLCSSPLSNSEWSQDEVGRRMTPSLVTKYWDAYFVLRDLNLKQLDIAGNVVAGEEFSSFVPQVVPTLVWLNGHKLRS